MNQVREAIEGKSDLKRRPKEEQELREAKHVTWIRPEETGGTEPRGEAPGTERTGTEELRQEAGGDVADKSGAHKAAARRTQERELILIGLSESGNCMRVIRTAGRLAMQLNARLKAVYVETKHSGNLSERAQKNLEECKNLAKSFGATIVTAYGEDIAYQLAEVAKVNGAKRLFIGMSGRSLYKRKEDIGVLVTIQPSKKGMGK